MMPVSTKLTLMVLVLPVLFIYSVFGVSFYFYRESLDASTFFTAISSLLSATLVSLLVWERLRDSLSRKLEYVHKNFLSKLYSDFRNCDLFENQVEIKRLEVDLRKYSRFMEIPIYPRRFLINLYNFLYLHNEFYKRLKKIEELTERESSSANLYRDAILDYIGLKPGLRSKHNVEGEEWSKRLAQNINRENPQLVNETTNFLEKNRRLRDEILNQLEDFFKSNNLSLESESSSIPPHH
jgi:hypothetical protein